MRLKLISCEVLYREMCAAVARSPHQVDVEFLPKGLHDLGCRPMLDRLQQVVDGVDAARYDAVLLGYGLCGNGLVGLRARRVPVVLSRAHDCITLFLGSKERYTEYFHQNPGVYFKTTGWIERGTSETSQLMLQRQGFGLNHAEMVARYGEDNAEFLEEALHSYLLKYTQYTFIEMGVEPDDRFEKCTLEAARERGWKFEKVRGDMSLIQGLVNGEWDAARYLVVPAGWCVAARHNGEIIGAEPAAE